MKKLTKQIGIGLIEVLITLAIGIILATVAVPSMKESFQNSKTKSLLRELTTAIQIAQSEAIKQSLQVTIRPHKNQKNEWLNGWDIFSDINRDGSKNGADMLLQTFSIPSNSARIISENGKFSSWLGFLPTGATKGSSGLSGILKVCRPDGSPGKYWNAVVQASGNVITERGTSSCA